MSGRRSYLDLKAQLLRDGFVLIHDPDVEIKLYGQDEKTVAPEFRNIYKALRHWAEKAGQTVIIETNVTEGKMLIRLVKRP